MGRHENARLTVEDCRIIDVSTFKPYLRVVDLEKCFTGCIGWRDPFGNLEAVLGYWVGKSRVEGLAILIDPELTRTCGDRVRLMAEYLIPISSSRPHAGGVRHWFRCPVEHDGTRCGRRVKKLCLPPGEEVFGCRGCHHLTYRSCQEHDKHIDKLAEDPDAWREILNEARRSPDPQKARLAHLGLGAMATAVKRMRKGRTVPPNLDAYQAKDDAGC